MNAIQFIESEIIIDIRYHNFSKQDYTKYILRAVPVKVDQEKNPLKEDCFLYQIIIENYFSSSNSGPSRELHAAFRVFEDCAFYLSQVLFKRPLHVSGSIDTGNF
jgi:hypothetical protein